MAIRSTYLTTQASLIPEIVQTEDDGSIQGAMPNKD